MSSRVRSAVIVLLAAVAVIVGAAHRGTPESARAGEHAGGAANAKSAVALLPEVSSSAAAGVPEVDSAGTRSLTGLEGKTVALTFDDGPHPDYTPAVLEILREYEVVATFCLVGPNAQQWPELVRDIVADGHVLCNHTVSHDVHLPDRDRARIDDEIADALDAIHDAAPEADVPFYRAPGGNFAENVNDVARSHDHTPLGWSIDPGDWKQPGAGRIRDDVIGSMHPGAVVLFHDGGGNRSGTVAALPAIIEALRDADYEFVVPAT